MGAIQGAINSMFSSAAVGLGVKKHFQEQAAIKQQQSELLKQGQKAQESIKSIMSKPEGNPSYYMNYNYSAATKTHNQEKSMEALNIMSNNGVAAYTQKQKFIERLEKSKGVIKASRKNITGGRK